MTPFILLVIGLLLIFLEFYLPGMVIGTLGAILLIASVLVFANESHSPLAIIAFTLVVFSSIYFLIRYTLKRIPKAKPGYSIYLKSDQEGFRASHYDASAIGKKAQVVADLKPGGYVLVDGKRHQAISQTGYIPQGSEVMIIGGQEESLIVKPMKKDELL